jgi:hypothetical protein
MLVPETACTLKKYVKHKFMENNTYGDMTANKLFKKMALYFLFVIKLPLVFIAEKFYNDDDEDGYD